VKSSPIGPRPVLVLNPVGDADFAALAGDLVDEGCRTPEELQRALRSRHPYAVVHPRELAGEPSETWYVYRDGRWVAPAG
jgi:hypothetical protein